MSESHARNAFIGRPSIDRLKLSVSPATTPRLRELLREARKSGLVERTRFEHIDSNGLRYDYILKDCGLKFALKVWGNDYPTSAVLEVYDIARDRDTALLWEVLLSELAGTSALTLSEIEFTRDLIPVDNLSLKALFEKVTNGMTLRNLKGVPVAWIRGKDRTRPTLKLASDGFDYRSDRFLTVYIGPAPKKNVPPEQPRFVRVEMTWTRDAMLRDPRFAPYLNFSRPVPITLLNPLYEVEWRTFDADSFRAWCSTRRGSNARTCRDRMRASVFFRTFMEGFTRSDVETFANYAGWKAECATPDDADAVRIAHSTVLNDFHDRHTGWSDRHDRRLWRWKGPDGVLGVPALTGRLRAIFPTLNMRRFFPLDEKKAARIRAGRVA